MPEPNHLLTLSEEELCFTNVRLGPTYERTLTIRNPLPCAVELTIRPANPERYAVEPDALVLKPQDAAQVTVRLRLLRPPPARRSDRSSPLKDSFLIRSSYGAQRFFATLSLWGASAPVRAAEGGGGCLLSPVSEEPERAAVAPRGLERRPEAQTSPPAPRTSIQAASQHRQRPAEDTAQRPGNGEGVGVGGVACAAACSTGAAPPPLCGGAAEARADSIAEAAVEVGKEAVLAQLRQLDATNQELQETVFDTALALSRSRAEAEMLGDLNEELMSDVPSVREIVRRMQEDNEAKAAKVLVVLQGKDDEIAELHAELEARERQLQAFREEASGGKGEAELLSLQLESVIAERRAAQEAAAASCAEAEAAEQKLRDAKQTIAELQEQAQRLHTQLEARAAEVSRSREAQQAAEAQAKQSGAKLEEVTLALAHLQAERCTRHDLLRELEERERRVYGLVETSVEAEQGDAVKMRHLQEELHRREAEVLQLRAALSTQDNGGEGLSAAHAESRKSVSGPTVMQHSKGASPSQLHRRVAELEEAKQSLQTALAEAKAEAESKGADLEAAAVAHGAELKRLRSQLEGLGCQLQETSAELAASRDAEREQTERRAQAEDRAKQFEQLLETARAEASRLAQGMEEASERERQAEAAHAAQLSEQQELLQRLSARLSAAKRFKHSAAENGADGAAAVTQLQEELRDARAQLEQLQLQAEEDRHHREAQDGWRWSASGGAGGSAAREARRELLTTRQSSQLAALEQTVQSQAVEIAELRQRLTAALHSALKQRREMNEDIQSRDRRLEESEKRWRCHRHDGETRRKLLEEQVRMLSSKSDLHSELASAGAQLREALMSAATHQQRATEAEAALAATEEQLQAARAGLAAAEERAEHVVVHEAAGEARRLTEQLLLKQREEIKEMQQRLSAAQLAQQLTAAPPSGDGPGENTAAVASESAHRPAAMSGRHEIEQLLRERDAAIEKLRAIEARETARDGAIASELGEVGRLQATLQDVRESMARERLQREASHLRELGDARAAAHKAQGLAEEAASERTSVLMREANAAAALREARRRSAAAAAAAAAREEELNDELRAARAEAEASAANAAASAVALQEKSVQLTILTETVEALQGGDEAEAKIASLSAQLSACQTVTSRLSRRLRDATVQLQSAEAKLARSATSAGESARIERELRAELGTARSAEEVASSEASALSRQLQQLKLELRQADEKVTQLDRRSATLEAQHEATQAQLSSQQSRHFERLQRERSAHAAAMRSLQEQLVALNEQLDARQSLPYCSGAAPPQEPQQRTADGSSDAPLQMVRRQLLLAIDELQLQLRAASSGNSNQHRTRAAAATEARRPSEQGCRLGEHEGSTFMTSRLLSVDGVASDGPNVGGALSECVNKLRDLLIEHNVHLGRALRRVEQLTLENGTLRQQLSVVEPALDRHIVERDVCERQLLLLQRHLASRDSLLDAALGTQLRHAEATVASLSAQLERSNGDSIALEARASQLDEEVQSLRRELQLQRREPGFPDHVGMVESALLRTQLQEEAAESEADASGRLMEFFEQRVLRGIFAAAEPPEQLLVVCREVAALKISEERLANSLDASERRADAAKQQLASMKEVLRGAERELLRLRAEASAAGTEADGTGIAACRAELQQAQSATRAAHERQMQAENRAAAAEQAAKEALQLRDGMAEWQRMLQDAGEQRLQKLRSSTETEHAAAVEKLRGRLLDERLQHSRAVRLLQQQANADLQAARDAWAAERHSMQAAWEQLRSQEEPASSGHLAVASAPQRPRQPNQPQPPQTLPTQRAASTEVRELTRVNSQLQAKIASLQQQLDAKSADLEAREGAIRGIEGSLVAVHTSLSASLESGNGGSVARRPASSGSVKGGSASTDPQLQPTALARQLVQAKLAEHDAKRKLRVASRAELRLRDALAARDERLRLLRGGDGQAGMELPADEVESHASTMQLRLWLAKARAEAEAARQELAEERARAEGGDRDVDLQRLFERLAKSELANRPLSHEVNRRSLTRKGRPAKTAEAAEATLPTAVTAADTEADLETTASRSEAAVQELRAQGVLQEDGEENVKLLVEAVQLLSAQVANLEAENAQPTGGKSGEHAGASPSAASPAGAVRADEGLHALVERLSCQLVAEQQQHAQVRLQLDEMRRAVSDAPLRPSQSGASQAPQSAACCVPSAGTTDEEAVVKEGRSVSVAMEAAMRAELVEERVHVRRLQQELQSAEQVARIEMSEMQQRLSVLLEAQRTSRARHMQQSAALAEVQGQLSEAKVQLAQQKLVLDEHAAQRIQLAQRRAALRSADGRQQRQAQLTLPGAPAVAETAPSLSPSQPARRAQGLEARPRPSLRHAGSGDVDKNSQQRRRRGARLQLFGGEERSDQSAAQETLCTVSPAATSASSPSSPAGIEEGLDSAAQRVQLAVRLRAMQQVVQQQRREAAAQTAALIGELRIVEAARDDRTLLSRGASQLPQELRACSVREAELLAQASQGQEARAATETGVEALQAELQSERQRREAAVAASAELSRQYEAVRDAWAQATAQAEQAEVKLRAEYEALASERLQLQVERPRIDQALTDAAARSEAERGRLEADVRSLKRELEQKASAAAQQAEEWRQQLSRQEDELEALGAALSQTHAEAQAAARDRQTAAQAKALVQTLLAEVSAVDSGAQRPQASIASSGGDLRDELQQLTRRLEQSAGEVATGAETGADRTTASVGEGGRGRHLFEVRVMQLEAEKRMLQREAEQARGAVSAMSARFERLQAEKAALDEERKALTRQSTDGLRSSRREVARLQEQLEEAQSRLQVRLSIEDEVRTLSEACRAKARALKGAQEEAARHAKQLALERGERQRVETQLSQHRAELTVLEERLARLTREARSKDQLLRETRARLEAAKAAETQSAEERKRAEERAKAAAAELARKERLIADQRDKLEQREAALAAEVAEAERRSAEAAAQPLRRAVERKEAAVRATRSKLETSESALGAAREELESARAEIARREARSRKHRETTRDEAVAESVQAQRCAQQLKGLLEHFAQSLQAGVSGGADEERQLAVLSHSLLQLSPAELGLAERADISTPTKPTGGASATISTPVRGASASSTPLKGIKRPLHSVQLLREALEEPLDTNAALAVLLRLVDERIDAASSQSKHEVNRLASTLADYDRMLQHIRAQVQAEQRESEVAIAQRDALIARLQTT